MLPETISFVSDFIINRSLSKKKKTPKNKIIEFISSEHNYQEDIAHLQDEVDFLKANLTAVWERLHEHDELHRAAQHHERRPLRSVVRETRRYRVTFNFFMDIPDHPGGDGEVDVQGK